MPRISRRPWLIAVALALTLSATALAAGIAEGAVRRRFDVSRGRGVRPSRGDIGRSNRLVSGALVDP
jgi:hypothetical protein